MATVPWRVRREDRTLDPWYGHRLFLSDKKRQEPGPCHNLFLSDGTKRQEPETDHSFIVNDKIRRWKAGPGHNVVSDKTR